MNGQYQTINFNGTFYYLVPVETQPPENTEPEALDNPIFDFLPDELTPTTSQPYKDPFLANNEEKRASIRVVNATDKTTIQKAEGKPYEYRERYLTHTLSPQDVVGYQRQNPDTLNTFRELPQIAANDAGRTPPKGTWGFYGPGIEFDSVY